MILTFIDTETTGLDLFRHEIIDLAFLTLSTEDNKKFKKVKQYNKRIKPKNISAASPIALKINGYTKRKWQKSIAPAAALTELKHAIEISDCLVGQNLIFDYRFINKSFDTENILRPKYPKYIDTKFLADQLVHDKVVKRSSLDFLCEHYNIETKGRSHTAIVDVLRTFELYKKLLQTCEITYLNFKEPYDPLGVKI